MDNNLQINTGEKRITINDDPSRVIVFNPSDAIFAEKFYNFISEIQSKFAGFEARAKLIDANKKIDENQLPANFPARLAFMKEMHAEICAGIDQIFGAETSQKIFGTMIPTGPDVYEQFFNGISPFIQQARAEKIGKYTNKRTKKVLR